MTSRMPNGARNAKNFPKWPELVAMLNAEGHEVIQVAGQNEERVEGVAMFLQGFPLEKLEEVLRDCDTWISVDSWMPHFCATLREFQYSHWFDVPYNEDAFVGPEAVMDALHGRLAQVASA